ncbi:MAG: DUF4397 domain-containing protein [Vicingaceae bacterium]
MNLRLTTLTLLLAATSQTFGQFARVQAIHNCPDPAAATVDVWIDNTKLLDDFDYKSASPYIDAPAGTSFTLSVCTPTSTDTTNAIFQKSFTLASGTAYTVVASGGLAQTGSTAFDLRAYAGQEQAANQGMSEVSVNIIHGSYDAPAVDIYEIQVPAGALATGVSFGQDLGAYTNLPAADFDIQVRTSTGVVAAEFDVNVSGFADSAITVLATGYLDPMSAVGNEPFGLIAVFPNGTVATLPSQAITPARLQVIHNAAATDAGTVDVWLNDGPNPLLDDFDFRTSSPFIDAPAGEFFDVSIAGPMSTDTANALFRETFILESGKTYIVIASGNIGTGSYTPAAPFSLEVVSDARETSMTSGNVDVLVWHGSTDAPTVDVVETLVGAGTIVDDISYGESQGYLDLGATEYALEVRDETGATTVAKYYADITTLADQAITILASGYLTPSNNNNGEAFGLWVALPSGGALLELGVITGIEEKSSISEAILFPNPVEQLVTLNFNSEEAGIEILRIVNMNGQVVYSEQRAVQTGVNTVSLNLSNLESGNYILALGSEQSASTVRFIKQ